MSRTVQMLASMGIAGSWRAWWCCCCYRLGEIGGLGGRATQLRPRRHRRPDQERLLRPRQQPRLLYLRGTFFHNSFVTTAVCCPSRASTLTGLYTDNDRITPAHRPRHRLRTVPRRGVRSEGSARVAQELRIRDGARRQVPEQVRMPKATRYPRNGPTGTVPTLPPKAGRSTRTEA